MIILRLYGMVVKSMRRAVLILAMVFLGLLCGFASAERLLISEGITSLESEAFSGSGCDSVIIPPTVISIASDAFPASVRTVYGAAGSAAESFARSSGRTFVDVGLTIADPVMPRWLAPGAALSVRIGANGAYGVQAYRVQLEKDGAVVYASPWSANGEFLISLAESGVYDVRVQVRNEYLTQEKLFSSFFTLAEPIHFAAETLRVNVGAETPLLAETETRPVTFAFSTAGLVQMNGSRALGLKAGTCTLTVTATEAQGTVTAAIPLEVCVKVDALTLSAPSYVFVGKTANLPATVTPSNATYGKPTYTSSNEAILSVSAAGVLTGKAPGSCTITAVADGVTAEVEVISIPYPTALQIVQENPELVLYTRNQMQLLAVFSPAGAYSDKLRWRIEDNYYGSIDANGVVTASRPGTTRVYVSASDVPGVSGIFTLKVLQGATSIALSAEDNRLFLGDQLPIQATFQPSNVADRSLTWTSSDPSIAQVDENGVVSSMGVSGVVTITATTINGVSSALTLRAYDQAAPVSFTLNETALFLNKGDTCTLYNSILPAGAISTVEWSSSSPHVVSVDQEGHLVAHTSGSSRVTVISTIDASVSATCVVTVLNPNRTLLMPPRRTGTADISATLNKISAIKASAGDELKALYAAGKISSQVMNERQAVINRAFEMYSFPWMTLNVQEYWNAENSEDGTKDFKPGIVYYGLPYVSGSYTKQRLYNVSKAVSENRYYRSSEGNYYILNQDNLMGKTYCGNDCSGFVALSYFGAAKAEELAWRTNHFSTTDKFVTLAKTDELYPGDILVKGYAHVVLFLYYANPEHTQVVILEQGGAEAAINTISSSIYNLSYYYNGGYNPRRYSAWN